MVSYMTGERILFSHQNSCKLIIKDYMEYTVLYINVKGIQENMHVSAYTKEMEA